MNKVFPTNSSTLVVNGKVGTVIWHDGYYTMSFVQGTVWAPTLSMLVHLVENHFEKLEIF